MIIITQTLQEKVIIVKDSMETNGELGEKMSIKQLRRSSQVKDVHLKVERTRMERKPVSHYRVSVEMQGTGSMG